jgi:hypothetical protein
LQEEATYPAPSQPDLDVVTCAEAFTLATNFWGRGAPRRGGTTLVGHLGSPSRNAMIFVACAKIGSMANRQWSLFLRWDIRVTRDKLKEAIDGLFRSLSHSNPIPEESGLQIRAPRWQLQLTEAAVSWVKDLMLTR